MTAANSSSQWSIPPVAATTINLESNAFVSAGQFVGRSSESTHRVGSSSAISAPAAATNVVSDAPAVLSGKGLAQHSFLYTGERDCRKTDQTMFVVRGGKVVWTYSIPIKDADGTLQELGDATMLANGNPVICNWCPPNLDPKYWPGTVQVLEVTPEKNRLGVARMEGS